MLLNVMLLVAGVFFCSTAIVWIKLSTISPILLAGLRCLVAATILLPLYLRDRARFPERPSVRRTILPGLLLAVHFMSWILGARAAQAANASLIVNMVPVAMPLILLVMLRERLTKGELAGTLISIVGLILMGFSDFQLDMDDFNGDLICFGSMLFFAVYLAMARRNSDFPSLWLYVVPLYALAGTIATIAGIPFAKPLEKPLHVELLFLAALGIFPTVLGHSLLNRSMKHLRGQVVALASLCQFIFAGFMAYFIPAINEKPAASFYPAAALVTAGIIIALRSKR